MFSALKKLAKGGDDRCPAPVPMSSSLQKKFSKGVHYNMKILIKGDRNVGKSCLLQRLQGGPFIEQYTPTDQIQVAPIHWTYKNTDFIVKVEVWEVVDKGRTRKKPPLALKLDNQSVEPPVDDTPVLDASFMDVHKDANGVILIMDITKPWTFEYVVKELEKIPEDLPVVVLGNHCDMMHHRQVHAHHIDTALEHARTVRSAPIRYAESSMRNGFGLRFLHKFLNIPFLRLQRASLLLQLQRNEQDSETTRTELDHFMASEEADYTLFTERLANKRKASTAGQDVPAVGKSIVLGGGKPIVPPHVNPLLAQSLAAKPRTPERDNNSQQSSYVSPDLLKPKHTISMDVTPTKGGESSVPTTPTPKPTEGALDEFYAGNLDTSFLEDLAPVAQTHDVDSDSDDGNVMNPMVTFDEDDLDEFYETTSKSSSKINTSSLENQKHTGKSTNSDQKSSTLNYKNSTTDFRNSTTDFKSPTSNFQTHTPDFKSSTFNFKTATSDFEDPALSLSISQESITERLMKTSLKSDELDETAGMEADYLWTADSSVRRSPEGGEDPDLISKTEEKSEKKHKKKKSKDKERERNKELGDGDKERKEKKHKHKRSKEKDKKSPQQDLLSPGESTIDYGEYDSI